jgi:hypothetical protein
MTAENVRHLFFKMAGLFRDWGTTGSDNLYGRGGATAPRNHSTIVMLNRSLGNTSGTVDLPYYYVTQAHNYVHDGGRMILLGGDYPECPITLTKSLLVEDFGSTAVVGSP